MKEKYIYLFAVIVLIGIGVWVFQSQKINQTSLPAGQGQVVSTTTPVTTKVEYSCLPGKSAFALLSDKNQIKSSESTYGQLVTEINGVSQGSGKYWLYSVDGREATVSASAYVCQDSEQISWELR